MYVKTNKISIVIPIYNEEENIFKLIDEIHENLDNNIIYEIILVNDCSTDNFKNEIKKHNYNNLILINNLNNFGQSKSIYLGVNKANFEDILTLDGDGQNNPKDILKLCHVYFKNKYTLVSGIRKKRKDSQIKILSSIIANKFRNLILKDNCPDTGCGIKIFKKKIFLKIPFFNGIHRFIPALFVNMNQKVLYIDVDHRYRIYGNSKYGTFDRLFRGLRDIIRVLLIIRKIKND